MSRRRYLIVVTAGLILAAAEPIPAESPSARRIGCDSAATDSMIHRLFGDKDAGRTIVDLVFPERGWRMRYISPWGEFEFVRAAFDRWRIRDSNGDSLDVLFYATQDISEVVDLAGGIMGAPYNDYRAAVIPLGGDTASTPQTFSIFNQVYDDQIPGCGRTRIDTMYWLPIAPGKMVLSSAMSTHCTGNHSHSYDRQGFWEIREGKLEFLGALWTGQYSVSGVRQAYSMTGTITLEDLDSGGVSEVVYSRRSGRQDENWSTKFEDRYRIVLGRVRDRIRPIALLDDQSRQTPIRPHLPQILYPCARTDADSPPPPGDARVGQGCPGECDAEFVMEELPLPREYWQGEMPWKTYPHANLKSWLDGDSVRFVFLYDRNRSYTVWFDRDLTDDLREPGLTESEFAVVIDCRDTLDGHVKIRTCRQRQEDKQIAYEVVREQTRVAQTRAYDGKREVMFRLSQDELGLVPTNGNIPVAGIAMELAWDSLPPTDAVREPSVCYPRTFIRTDPRTWGNLTLGTRSDTCYAPE